MPCPACREVDKENPLFHGRETARATKRSLLDESRKSVLIILVLSEFCGLVFRYSDEVPQANEDHGKSR